MAKKGRRPNQDLLKEIESQNSTPAATEQEDTKSEEDAKSEEVAVVPQPQVDISGIEAALITMPKMSDTMTEGTIAVWHKKVGDEVKSGDILAEVETDKATMELESYEDGTLLYIGVGEGESVEVDGVLAIVGAKDADYKTPLI